MEIQEIMALLGERLNVDLAPDEDGMCPLLVDGMKITIAALPELDAVGLWGEIGEPPPQHLEDLLSAMLNANHCFRGTGGATISRDPDTGRFCLCRMLDARAVDGDGFFKALESFVNTQETWCRMLADYRGSAAKSAPDAEERPPAFGGDGFISV